MSEPVENLVERLQAKRSGKGWIAKCPGHDDRKPSLSIDEGSDGRALLKCHAGCSTDDVIAALGLTPRDLFPVTSRRQSDNGATLNWQECNAAFTDRHIERLADWRSYSGAFCSELHKAGLVGLFNDCISFPVHDRAGNIVAAHYRLKDSSWRYHPQGAKVRPLVIGELIAGEPVHVFESQWDAFAFMDRSGERSGLVITRGAGNGALVAGLIPQNSIVYLWPQNDAAGQKWEKDICSHIKNCIVKSAKIPAQFADLNDWTRDAATDKDLFDAYANAETVHEPPRPLIEFCSPLELKNFVPPPGIVMVGDCHIVKGSVFVIGGAPGVGKSRASVSLAVAGATRSDWFGLSVHRKLKVMIIQNENGRFRLMKEFLELNCEVLEDYIRVCPPPPYGFCFGRDEFRAQLAAAIAEFKPDIVIFDPWNAAARDDRAREYLETFDALRSVLPLGDDAPALGIVAHTRKPKTDERASGRALLNLLAGSYVLGSVPRTVFVMQAASDDTTDNRIVWTCCKNNDGELGARSVWERRNGLFAPVTDFDFEKFDAPDQDKREVICEDDVRAVFENGALTKAEAKKLLEQATGASRSTCYNALDPDGRFAKHLNYSEGKLAWK